MNIIVIYRETEEYKLGSLAFSLLSKHSSYLEGSMVQERRHDMGEGGYCICRKCGERTIHQRGVPCQEERCPECGARMLREGSYHELLKRKQAGKNEQN